MGVRINGVWHEELADPGTGGEDSGSGREFTSNESYNQTSTQMSAGNKWGENLDTWADGSGGGGGGGLAGALGGGAGAGGDLGSAIDRMWKAMQEGNLMAFNEEVRQFNQTFGLNQDIFKEQIRQYNQDFAEKIRQYNENLAISQAGLTGQYQGAPTLPALTGYATQFGTWGVPTTGQETLASQLQAANLLGTYRGQQTLAANQQAYAQQMGMLNQAAALQANPFRQAEIMGQFGNLLAGRGVAGFQAPGGTSQTDFSGMGNMQRLIDDIRGGPGAINSQSVQSTLDAIPTPNKVNSVEFMRSSPMTQNLLLSGIQQKYGIGAEDAMNQIRNTLPGFTSPSTFGQVRG